MGEFAALLGLPEPDSPGAKQANECLDLLLRASRALKALREMPDGQPHAYLWIASAAARVAISPPEAEMSGPERLEAGDVIARASEALVGAMLSRPNIGSTIREVEEQVFDEHPELEGSEALRASGLTLPSHVEALRKMQASLTG